MASTNIQPGDTFRMNSGAGVYTSKVLRPHRDVGYWETTITEGGHPALINSIQIVRFDKIQAAMASAQPIPVL